MSMQRKFTTICCAALLSLGLAACGGGGDDSATVEPPPPPPPPPPTYPVSLPDDHGLMAGTTMLPHGDTVVGDTTLSCANMDGCTLTVSKDPVTGAYSATATGGEVTVAVAEPPPPPPGPDPVQLAAAQDAARDAWRAARATLAGLAGKESADPAAYQRAVDAVADARAAYDAALMAMTVQAAEEARDDAVAANEMAMAQAAAVIYAYDKPAIAAARTAAMDAAEAAKMAYEAAKAALAGVESIKAIDMASYDMAMAKVEAAKMAYEAAKMAAEAAEMAMLKADAEAQRDAAQDAAENAGTANTDAMKYTGMVQMAEDSALASAKTTAQTAYDAAKKAYDAAKMRFDALSAVNDDGRAKKDDDVDGNFFRASDALDRAKTALDAAMEANDMAQAATVSSDAASHQSAIDTAKGNVDTETAGVAMYAGLVEAAYNSAQAQRNTEEQNRLAEEQRVRDVAAARGRAMQSYMDADTDATNAEKAAEAAAEIAPGSAGAIAAKAAAMAARTAASAAKAAHDAIMDEMTKEQADAQATTAATAAGTANTQYMLAKTQNDAIQTAHQIAEETQRVAGVTAAKNAAGKAVDAARTAMNNADAAAMAAETARDNAKADYEKAMAARTNSAKAKEEYEKAKTAAMAARTAADDAEAAYMAAKAAADGIDDAGTVAAAETARDTAETKSGEAVTAASTADGHKTTAETAEENAMMYASSHTLGLLMVANAQSETDTEARAEAITAWAAQIAAAAGSSTDADNDSRASPTLATVTAAWPGIPDDEDTADTDESAGNMLTVTITNVATAAITSDTVGMPDADPVVQPNAKAIDGLPGFMYGFDISDDTTRILVFTNKDMDAAPVEASEAVTARSVENVAAEIGATNNITKLGTKSGNTYIGAEWTPGTEAPLTGTLTCPSGVACSVDASTAADGTVTINSITGYVFTGSRAAKAAVTACDAACQAAANTYLAFGVWLNEDGNNDDTADDPAFGAFAGTDSATAPVDAAVTGTARYEGSAAGVYTAGSSVDYFQADATLNANFGVAPETGADTAQGTVTGMIDNIMVGGVEMSDVINLFGAENNIGTTGSFSGAARMGDSMVAGDAVTYMYNGRWSGQFYGPTADDTTTADVNESHVAPMAAAGTFGVTGTDNMGTMDDTEDDVTRSYVGAFGAAHKQ